MKVCSVDKANVLEVSQLWREVVIRVAAEYPSIELSHMYVDNCAMQVGEITDFRIDPAFCFTAFFSICYANSYSTEYLFCIDLVFSFFALQLIRYPKQFDTIVCGNMFGDILSDEASMLVGSLGMLPSGTTLKIPTQNF